MRRTLAYATMTKDEAQRSIRTFYEAVNDERAENMNDWERVTGRLAEWRRFFAEKANLFQFGGAPRGMTWTAVALKEAMTVFPSSRERSSMDWRVT